MMDDMPRPRPPFLQRHTTRHGRTVWYVRIGKCPLVRIRGDFGSPEFMAAYEAAVRGERPPVRSARAGTLAWLAERYRETPAWRDLSLATRRQRENILKHALKSAGAEPYVAVTEHAIVAGRDRRTASQGRHFIDTMRGLFAWAKEAGFVDVNPAASVKYPIAKKTQGFPAWTEDDLASYEARWPLGTKERVWLAVLLYTGLRRGDAVRIGRQHVRNGVASLRTEKTDTDVHIPILPELAAALAAGPTGELAFICGATGKPLTKESFGNMFSAACRAAGVQKSAHGVRKAGATRAANNGATVAQLEAIFGWAGGRMASLYTKSADRARLAREAIGKLANDGGTSMVLPGHSVRAAGEKDQ